MKEVQLLSERIFKCARATPTNSESDESLIVLLFFGNRTYKFSSLLGWYRLGALTIQPRMKRDSASEQGFGIPSQAFISSIKGDSRKDGIGRRVSRTNKIRLEKGELAKLDKIGMGIGTCIDVPDRLMLPG
ncbi:hypothetical protein Q3G72_009979 [Acer saccharum]|nr:hypothetical protein Q3G72_009979 [Acer saccharum]